MLKTTKFFGEIRSVKFSRGSKMKSFALAFCLLMFASTFLVLSTSEIKTANAQTTSVPSNMLQYEWTEPGGDAAHSFSSTGPGPNQPNIAWKAQVPGATGYLTASNGLVFAEGNGKTYALDGATGKILWTVSFTGGKIKIDNTYMLIGTRCVKIADGTTVWTAPAGFNSRGSSYQGMTYVPELKRFVDAVCGWALPDPSQPPTLAWNLTAKAVYGEMRMLAVGGGKAFIGCGDSFVWCIDALTGNTLWITPSTDRVGYGGSYIDGKFIHGALDSDMHCWDANTGVLLWTYNPNTWYGMFASATGAAYGMVYEHNQDNYVYAINATTGKLVWRQLGPGIGYSNTLTIAGGKVYVQMGENQYRDFNTGAYAYSEFNCYDAYTGKLLWSMPMENGAPFNLQCNAYGNLYVIPNRPSNQQAGVWTYVTGGAATLNEVWCISSQSVDYPMAYADVSHSSEGAGPTSLALQWKFKTDAVIQSAPVFVNGVCYFGNQLGTIYALNAASSAKLWTFQTGAAVKSSVAVVNGKVYTGTDDGKAYCIDASTGAKIWETSAGGVIQNPFGWTRTSRGADHSRSSPMVLNDKVYVGALDGNLYCLDANSGAVAWKFKAGLVVQATPTIVDNTIYLPASTPSPNGTVYKLDLNGNVIWQKSIPYVLDKTPGDGMYLLASATVAEGMVFIRNALRLNYALNATTGEIIWTYDGIYNPGTPGQAGGVHQFMPMLYKYGLLYFNDYYGITCLNASNGVVVWSNWLSRENLAQGLSYSYQRIYTVTEFGVLYVIDAITGQKLSYYEFGPEHPQMRGMPVPYNGSLYVGTCDWNMYCFGDARVMSASVPKPQVLASDAPISSLAVAPIVAAPNVTETASSSSTVYIAIAVAVIAVAASAAVVVLRRRR
jgi:outer membrane protein assembly factor BamB